MRYSKRLIGIALLSIMSPICAQAAIVTIGIEATIDEVIDESNLLDGVVKAGDIITGSYKYDSEVLDTEPDFQNVGVYHQYAPDYSISLNVNDMNISSNINDGYYRISVVNNSADKGGDAYSIVSINNMDLNNGLGIEIISWQLDDPTGTAISSIELTDIPPILNDWQSIFGLDITSQKTGPNNDQFYIYSHVTAVTLIPEPTALLLLSLGVLVAKLRRVR